MWMKPALRRKIQMQVQPILEVQKLEVGLQATGQTLKVQLRIQRQMQQMMDLGMVQKEGHSNEDNEP